MPLHQVDSVLVSKYQLTGLQQSTGQIYRPLNKSIDQNWGMHTQTHIALADIKGESTRV